MDSQLIWGIIFTVLPITELRVGLPIILDYCLKNNLAILPFFLLVILLNSLVSPLLFFFLEYVNKYLLKWKRYNSLFNKAIVKVRKKNARFEKKFNQIGYLALILFVGIPLPGTGVWTGTFLAWLLGLEKKKSVLAIVLGVIIAGLLILIPSLGLLGMFY